MILDYDSVTQVWTSFLIINVESVSLSNHFLGLSLF